MIEASRLTGRVTTWNLSEPQGLIAVEAIHQDFPDAVVRTYSNDNGLFSFVNLRPGPYRLRCQVPGGPVYYEKEVAIEVGAPEQRIHFNVAPFRKGTWKTYTYLDGLTDNNVLALFQDDEGVLWLGTVGGLSRFDGAEFRSYMVADGLVEDHVQAIWGDGEGVLWLGTRKGLSRFDGAEFRNYTVADGLVDDQVLAIWGGDDGVVWLGTAGGFSRFDGAEFRNYTEVDGGSINAVRSIRGDDEGNLWLGMHTQAQGNGLYRFDGTDFSVFKVPHERRVGVGSVEIVDGAIWYQTGGELMHLNRKRGELVLRYRMARPSVHCAAADGGMWIGYRGLWYSDGHQAFFYGTWPHLIHAVLEGDGGIVWLGSENGLVRYDPRSLVEYSIPDSLRADRIQSLYRDSRGDMWMGTPYQCLTRFDGERFFIYTSTNGITAAGVRSYEESADGILWFGGRGPPTSLQRFDGVGFRRFAEREGISGSVSGLHLDGKGVLWVGGSTGLLRSDGEVFVRADIPGMPEEILALYGDADDALWLGDPGGLWRYDERGLVRFGPDTGGPGTPVRQFYGAADGTLWMVADDGVWSYDGTALARLGAAEGLPKGQVVDLYHDGAILWLATQNHGLVGYDGTAWTSLDERDGLPVNSVSGVVGLPDGTVVFGAFNSLLYYRRDTVTPTVRIKAVHTDRYSGAAPQVTELELGRRVSVEYEAIDAKTLPEKRQYRTRIATVSQNWSTPTRDNQFEWVPEQTGRHTIEVQAIDRDLNYSPVAVLELNVVPPWYLNAWIAVPGAAAILGLVLVAGVSSYRAVRARRDAAQLRETLLEQEQEARGQLEAQNTELQHARREADQANRAKSDFLANMSHEIRTPMNAVLGYAQILQGDSALSADQRHSVGAIARSGDHLLALINDVLDISKIEAGRQELTEGDFDLEQFLLGLATMFELRCQQQDLVWRMEGKVTRPRVRGDEGKLRQVLINLLGNAVKFTDEGSVSLQVEERESDRYRFAVADSGPGIALERQQTIFEPFQQEEAGITKGGSGLAIAARFIEMMGGRIELESHEGERARFSFELVLPPGEEPSGTRDVGRFANVKRLVAGQRVRALVVDDVAENRDVLQRVLAPVGVEVDQAEDGAQAVASVRATKPDIVFMDIRMPNVDGPEALRQIEAEHGEGAFKVVAVSASAFVHQRQEYLALGFADYIEKPFRAEQIYAALADLIGVEFEYEEEAAEAVDAEAFDPSDVVLPAEMYERLVEAMKTYSITQLHGEFERLEGMGEPERRLVQHLRGLARQYDIKAIGRVLDRIAHT